MLLRLLLLVSGIGFSLVHNTDGRVWCSLSGSVVHESFDIGFGSIGLLFGLKGESDSRDGTYFWLVSAVSLRKGPKRSDTSAI